MPLAHALAGEAERPGNVKRWLVCAPDAVSLWAYQYSIAQSDDALHMFPDASLHASKIEARWFLPSDRWIVLGLPYMCKNWAASLSVSLKDHLVQNVQHYSKGCVANQVSVKLNQTALLPEPIFGCPLLFSPLAFGESKYFPKGAEGPVLQAVCPDD